MSFCFISFGIGGGDRSFSIDISGDDVREGLCFGSAFGGLGSDGSGDGGLGNDIEIEFYFLELLYGLDIIFL